MFIKPEARKDAKGFSDFIDHFAVVANGVVLTTTGLYVAGFEFTGPDMDSLLPEECAQISCGKANRYPLSATATTKF